MDHTKSLKSNVPLGAAVETAFTADGDIIPKSVTYKDMNGQDKKVAMQMTPDGDYIPETGYTLDGDFNWPNQQFIL